MANFMFTYHTTSGCYKNYLGSQRIVVELYSRRIFFDTVNCSWSYIWVQMLNHNTETVGFYKL